MLELPEVPGVFCDAHLVDETGLRFLSVWGRDTAIQEFLARLSVPERDGGIRSFWIGTPGQEGAHCVPSVGTDRLMRLTARRTGSVFGELIHLWLYDRLAVDPDRSNGRALLLHHSEANDLTGALWELLKQTLWVPVLDHWRDLLLSHLDEMGCLTRLDGFCVGAFAIDLSNRERIEQEVSFLVRGGRLQIESSCEITAQAA